MAIKANRVVVAGMAIVVLMGCRKSEFEGYVNIVFEENFRRPFLDTNTWQTEFP
jgi:hypothetical protein